MKKGIFIILFVGTVAGSCWLVGTQQRRDAAISEDAPLSALSDDELYSSFRAARDNYERSALEELENAAEEICRRGLLRDLAPERIASVLGEPDSKSWVYLDQRVTESRNPLKRFTEDRASYWLYAITRFDTTIAMGLAFASDGLAWLHILRDTGGRDPVETTVFYAWKPQGLDDTSAALEPWGRVGVCD